MVANTVTIATGTTVIVEPGAIIKFKDDKDLIVNGTLDVRGTTSSLAYFTSLHDDAAGGDTNGNGASTTAAAGDWGAIQINSGASTTLVGVVVRHGGGSPSTAANVYSSGSLTARYADVSSAQQYGFYINSGTTTITDASIHNSSSGIGIASGTVTVASSSIFNNSSWGATRFSGPTSTMTNNFWGGWQPFYDGNNFTENPGPYNSITNASGAGNGVSSYIDYSPYTTAYLSDPTDLFWSPPGVNTSSNPYKMRVGSSTQYQAQLEAGIETWNDSIFNYVNTFSASSSPSSSWDIYVLDFSAGTTSWAGRWIPTITSTPFVIFNVDAMQGADSSGRQCIATHELGHALGLAHNVTGTIMYYQCELSSAQTMLGVQDLRDFNMLWGDSFFFDPHRTEGIIQW